MSTILIPNMGNGKNKKKKTKGRINRLFNVCSFSLLLKSVPRHECEFHHHHTEMKKKRANATKNKKKKQRKKGFHRHQPFMYDSDGV